MTDSHDSKWDKIAGKIHGELSCDDEVEFSQIMADSSNLHNFEKAREIHYNQVNAGQISKNGKVKSWAKVGNGIRIYQLKWIKDVLKYAPVIIVAFVTGNLLKTTPPENKEIRLSEITVPFGQMSQLTLSDGTKIWLNSGTTLRYPEKFGDDQRVISIEGEAYFRVAKMQNKPFTAMKYC